jgi:hypothetical protein
MLALLLRLCRSKLCLRQGMGEVGLRSVKAGARLPHSTYEEPSSGREPSAHTSPLLRIFFMKRRETR